jgi:hypothetical protein
MFSRVSNLFSFFHIARVKDGSGHHLFGPPAGRYNLPVVRVFLLKVVLTEMRFLLNPRNYTTNYENVKGYFAYFNKKVKNHEYLRHKLTRINTDF